MKTYIILLVVLGLSFACETIYVSEFLGQEINMNYSECWTVIDDLTDNSITITSPIEPEIPDCTPPKYNVTIFTNPLQSINHAQSNITCSGNDVRLNQHISLPSQTQFIDPISNNTYSCQRNQIEFLNQTLTGGQSYSSSERNISVQCLATQFSFINQTLTGGQLYNNTDRNVSILCSSSYPAINVSYSPSYGSFLNYTNGTINFNCTAPVYPKSNMTINITQGTSWNNETLNLSFICQAHSCYQNINRQLTLGESFRSDLCNISLTTPSESSLSLNQVIVAEFGRDIQSTKFGVTCRGPPKYDTVFNLTDVNDTFEDIAQKLKVTCTYDQSAVPWCRDVALSVEGLAKLSNDSNRSCMSYPVCINYFDWMLTPEEAQKGDIYGGVNRSIYECTAKCNDSLAQKDIDIQTAHNETAQYRNPLVTSNETIKFLINGGLIAMCIFLFLGSIIVYYILHHNKTKLDTKIQTPKIQPAKTVGGN